MSNISVEAAREIAAHLSAIMNNPHTPELIKHDLGNRITDMNSTIDQDTPDLIAVALLASQNAERRWQLAVEEVKQEDEYKEQRKDGTSAKIESDLPELISKVLNHPHVTNGVYDALSDSFSECFVSGAGDSPEYIAAMLGMKVKQKPARREAYSGTLEGLSPNLKPLADSLIYYLDSEQEPIDVLIKLLVELYRADDVEPLRDGLTAVTSYLYSATTAFDLACDDHVGKLRQEMDESQKVETAQAAA